MARSDVGAGVGAGVRERQRERTRRALLREGRALFAGRGYADVGLAELVAAAGVTKGALYHHFPGGKTDLFRAVLDEVQQEVGRRVASAADAHEDEWSRLTAGCREFLAAATAPGTERIMLVDGPAVLGWNAWRAMDEAASASHLAEALAALVEEGTLAPQPVPPLVHLLSGAMNEAALWLASSREGAGEGPGPEALEDTTAALLRMLDGLRARPARGRGDG